MNRHERYRQVARLHMRCLDRGFLGTLGETFLSLMYEAIDCAEQGMLLVEEEAGEVRGYVAACVSMGPIYKRMLRSPVRLVSALAPSLVSPSRIRRILEIVRYSRGVALPEGLPRAEMLTFAVDPRWRGHGVSDRLYRRITDEFRRVGVERFRFAVGEKLEPAHRFYRRMGAEVVCSLEVHDGARSLLYVQDV